MERGKSARRRSHALEQIGEVPRHRDHFVRTDANPPVKSQLRRRFEVETAPDPERTTSRPTSARTPDLVDAKAADGIPTPRPRMALSAVPRRAMAEREILSLPLDHRAGFLLAHVDGATSLGTIMDVSGMPPDETVAVIEQLLALRVIKLS